MGIHFLTFANSSYARSSYDIPGRILEQAKSFYKFKSIYHWSEADIPELIEKHKYHFSQFKDDGFGRWLWKPYIILKRLSELEEDEILLYMDVGSHLNSEGLKRFQDYLNMVNSTTKCNFDKCLVAKDVLVSKASRPASQSSHDLSTP